MVVDRDLAARLNGKKPESVFGIAVTVVPELGKPAYAGADHVIDFSAIGEFFDFFVFTILPMSHMHFLFLLKIFQSKLKIIRAVVGVQNFEPLRF
jgi:hypothetical protein